MKKARHILILRYCHKHSTCYCPNHSDWNLRNTRAKIRPTFRGSSLPNRKVSTNLMLNVIYDVFQINIIVVSFD